MTFRPDISPAFLALRPKSRIVGASVGALGLALFGALSFALFARLTLYGRVDLMAPGIRGVLIPVGLFVALILWYFSASAVLSRLAGRSLPETAAASFLPLLASVPVCIGVLTSESFAAEYWIDRSLKVELLLGLPGLVLASQAGIGVWLRSRLDWRSGAPILGVLLVALLLRLGGMNWGLPFAFQPEESSIYFRWGMDVALGGKWNPGYFQNPSLLIYLLGLEFMGVFAVARLLQFGQSPSDLYMVFRGEQELFYGLGRLNSVLLGIGTVLVVYLIAKRLWGERAGLVAALLLAVNFLHVRNSQYAVNDVPSTFFLVLSFYFALRIMEDGRLRDYLLAGLLAGLAASTKYNAGLVVVSIGAAHLLRDWLDSLRARRLGLLGLSALAAILGFLMGTPFAALDFPTFRGGFMSQLEMGDTAWSGQSAAATAWVFLAGVVQGAGLVAALAAAAGIVLLLVTDRKVALLLLSFPFTYFAFMASMDLFFVRWVVPAMPFVALAGAYALERAFQRSTVHRAPVLAAALFALALIQPAANSLRLDWLVQRTDTRIEANRWAELAIPRGSKVAVEAFSLLDQEALSFRATLQQREVELVWRATMQPMEYYLAEGFDYLAVSSFMYDRAFENPEGYRDRVEFYQRLDRDYPLAATFSPRADGRPAGFALDDTDTPFWKLWDYDRPGPTVKVYRLRG